MGDGQNTPKTDQAQTVTNLGVIEVNFSTPSPTT